MSVQRSRISSDIDFDRDGKHVGFLRLPHSVHRSAYGWIPIPVASVRNGEGPCALVIAGNHGDEYEGQIAAAGLLRALEPVHVRGSVIFLTAANFPAAMAGTRTSPLDDGNLNRAFPGNPDGTPTEQIAYYVESVLMPRCDVVIDLHSGGSSLLYVPSGLCGRSADPVRMEQSLALLRAFAAPVTYVATTPQGEDRTAGAAAERQGALHMAAELAGGGMVTIPALHAAQQGLRRVLRHVGVLDPDFPAEPAPPTRLMQVVGSEYYVYAPEAGLFEPLVELGDEVSAGQPAARIHCADTPWREPVEVRFAIGGTVICKRVPAPTQRGDCLFHLGTPFA